MKIQSYQIDKELGKGATGVVYQAMRDNKPCAIKIMRQDLGDRALDISLRFRKEASSLARLNHPALVKVLEVGEAEGLPYFAMEIVAGQSLRDQLIEKDSLNETSLIELSKTLASALAEIHRHGLIHRDLKPENVVLDGLLQPKIVDFGFVIGAAEAQTSEEVVGTVAYMAPEQSRMVKRPVDGRSDLYSLGVLFYECATGKLPYSASDMGELMRLHLIAPTPDVRALNPSIRPVLARIIAKLMAKDPDERYQTAQGLQADLESLNELDALERSGQEYVLGAKDFSVRQSHEVPLTGRKEELARMAKLWDAATKDKKGGILLVEGESGSGKSRLVSELLLKAQESGALTLTGKCEEHQQLPFVPLRQAIEQYLSQVQRLPEQQRKTAHERIRQAAREFAPIVKLLSKSLERILGESGQKAITGDVDPERIATAAAVFFAGLAQSCGPMILVVDDVQWLDAPSRRVLTALQEQVSSVPLLFICTARSEGRYRNAVEAFSGTINPRALELIQLKLLETEQIDQLVSHFLGGAKLDGTIVDRLSTRTKGNPFAIAQYLRALLEGGILRPKGQGWEVDADRFDELTLSSGLTSIITSRVSQLDEASAAVLSVAAIIGTRFDRDLLGQICRRSAVQIDSALAEAARAGLLERTGASSYQFVHDSVRDSLAAKLDDEERKDAHQSIAEHIDARAHGGIEHSADEIYALAHHFALGRPEKNPKRIYEAVLAAGFESMRAFALNEAVDFLTRALALAGSLQAPVPKLYELRKTLATAHMYNGMCHEAIEHFTSALPLAPSAKEKAWIHYLRGRAYFNLMTPFEGLDEGILGLQALGEPAIKNPALLLAHSFWTLFKYLVLKSTGIGFGSARKNPERLERRKLIQEIHELNAILASLTGKSTEALAGLFNLMLDVHYLGDCAQAVEPIGFLSFSFAAMGLRGLAIKAMNRASAIAQRTGDRAVIAMADNTSSYTMHWIGDPTGSEKFMRPRLQDFERWLPPGFYVGLMIDLARTNLQVRGYSRESLEVARALQKYSVKRNYLTGIMMAPSSISISLAILGESAEAFKEASASAELMTKNPRAQSAIKFNKINQLLANIESEESSAASEKLVADLMAYNDNPRYAYFVYRPFYIFLSYLRYQQYLKAPADAKPAALQKLKSALRDQAVSHNNLKHFTAHLKTLQAAVARVEGRPEIAKKLLQQAEDDAVQSDAPWALYEVARERARLYQDGQNPSAAHYEAKLAYGIALEHGWVNRAKWARTEFKLSDALTSVSFVSHANPAVRQSGAGPSPISTGHLSSTTSGTMMSSEINAAKLKRHLEAMLEVSLVCSSALNPAEQAKRALDKIVAILGGERGFLFLIDEESKRLEFRAGRDCNGQDLDEKTSYSTTVIRKVRESGQSIVVTGTEDGEVLGSESVVAHNLRSIIAAPLMLKEKLLGVVYLDNTQAKGVFQLDDVEILLAMANHVAIAIEAVRAANQLVSETAEKVRMEKELETAKTVQETLFPSPVFQYGPYRIAGYYEPASECGGDWWHYCQIGDKVLLWVGDATGHGAPAALITSAAKSASSIVERLALASPARIMELLNRAIFDTSKGRMQMTFFIACLDKTNGMLTYTSASHDAPYLLKDSGEPITNESFVPLIEATGSRLGQNPDSKYTEATVNLKPGDTLLFYTDGLIDLKSPDEKTWGVRNFIKCVSETIGGGKSVTPETAIAGIRDRFQRFRSGAPLEDDVTIFMCRYDEDSDSKAA